jgi:hypothetical protein
VGEQEEEQGEEPEMHWGFLSRGGDGERAHTPGAARRVETRGV